ncbi:MAG: hypothetical protein CM15mP120_06210 [Pseudomonadota bacterium]|nr:MAG: hypothetical protein CM15mP120_06210 [Pseudomonadota bacterium]
MGLSFATKKMVDRERTLKPGESFECHVVTYGISTPMGIWTSCALTAVTNGGGHRTAVADCKDWLKEQEFIR